MGLMKADDKISVIVPVYNVKPYLHKCVDSILSQTYQNIEILLIDDGSTDGCAAICDGYGEKDPRIKVLHKKNGGLSSARNAGLDLAAGEYILFVDSDDYINREMVQKLYDALVRNGADMCVCDLSIVDTNGKKLQSQLNYPLPNQMFDEGLYWKKLYETNSIAYIVAWNKLYRKNIWDDLRYPVNRINEDEWVLHHILKRCERIQTISYRGYNYVIRKNSIMSRKNKKANFDLFDGWKKRVIYFEKKQMNEEIQKQLSLYCAELIKMNRLCKTETEKTKFKEYWEEYKNYFKGIRKYTDVPIKEKIKFFLGEKMPKVTSLLIGFMYRRK